MYPPTRRNQFLSFVREEVARVYCLPITYRAGSRARFASPRSSVAQHRDIYRESFLSGALFRWQRHIHSLG